MAKRKTFAREDYFDAAMDDYPLSAKLLLGVVICVVGIVTKLLWPWRIEQGEKLWNDRRGRVLIMNHASFLETLLPSVSTWFRGIHVRPIYKSEFERNAFLRWLLPRVGGIPVERGTADVKAVRRAVAALKRGESVLVFPEGTRIKNDGELTEAHGAFALMARMAQAPVQPMAIVGAQDIRKRGERRVRLFWRVFVKVGDCVSFEDMTSEGRRQKTEEMARVGMEQVYVLRDDLRKEHPGKH